MSGLLLPPLPRKPVNSRRKGKTAELELAHLLTDLGFPATRGQQRKGGEDSPDVICEALGRFHLEVKRTKTCQMFSPAMLAQWDEQATRDAGPRRTPLVLHRWNGSRVWWVRVLTRDRRPLWQTLPDFLADRGTWEPWEVTG